MTQLKTLKIEIISIKRMSESLKENSIKDSAVIKSEQFVNQETDFENIGENMIKKIFFCSEDISF